MTLFIQIGTNLYIKNPIHDSICYFLSHHKVYNTEIEENRSTKKLFTNISDTER